MEFSPRDPADSQASFKIVWKSPGEAKGQRVKRGKVRKVLGDELTSNGKKECQS